MKIRSRIDQLKGAVCDWVAQTNKQHVAASIVDTMRGNGLEDMLADQGITFSRGDDIFKNARVDAQKIMRWLGFYEDAPVNKTALFDLESVIVAAMPLELRVRYLQDAYLLSYLAISPRCETDDRRVDMATVVQLMIKENAEAQVAMLNIKKQAHPGELENAYRELTESISVTSAAAESIRKELRKHLGEV